jgi:hypothetical protein
MRIAKQALVLVLMTAVSLAAHAGQARSGKSDQAVTVGEFAVMLATARGGARALDAGKAVDSLVKAGVPLPADARQPLTEKVLSDVLDFYGINAKAGAGRTVSPAKAESALLLLGSAVGAASKAAPAPSVTLDDCLALSNHGQCVVCCKNLGGAPNSCAKMCFVINKPSPSEPLP